MRYFKAEITIHAHYPIVMDVVINDVVELRQICAILEAGQPHPVTYKTGLRQAAANKKLTIPKYLKQAE